MRSKDDKILDFVFEFTRTFREKGHEVMVVAAHEAGIPLEDEIEGVKVKRFVYFYPKKHQKLAYGAGIPENIRRSTLAKIQALPFFLSGANTVRKAINEFKPDVVNAIWAFPQGAMCSFLKKFKKFPLVVSLVGSEAYLAKKFHIPWVVSFAANNAEEVVTNSKASGNAAKECGVKKEMEIIFWGIDDKRFTPEKNGKEIIERFKLQGKKVVLTIARLIQRKGVNYVVEAMPAVLKRHPDAVLVVGGDGPDRKALEAQAKQLGIERNVIFTGWVSMDDLPKYYCAADVFVLAAATDEFGVPEGGQGLVTKQAMASNCPVVTTNIGGIPDLTVNGDTGMLVEEKNPQQLAEAINRVLEDKALRKKIVEGGFRAVKERAVWNATAEKYLKVYEKAAKEFAEKNRR
ncbi:MAG: glycosyltransferase family 4 protein [Candidatus Diapherotrites archaeon]